MIVTAHQPNFLPGISVCSKVLSADAVIWLDCVQYSKGGWTNRNQLPDGNWLTVPIVKATDGGPIRDVLISDHLPWRPKLCDQIRKAFPGSDFAERVCEVVDRPWTRLVGLNAALLLLALPDAPPFVWEGHLAPRGDQGISDHLAGLVCEVGGSVYLSGPSGRGYLDEDAFHARGVEVRYWTFGEYNPSILTALAA